MRVLLDAKELKDALERTKGSGKYAFSDGIKTSTISDYVFLTVTGTQEEDLYGSLSIWNADATYIVNHRVTLSQVENIEWINPKSTQVDITLSISETTPILKKINGLVRLENTEGGLVIKEHSNDSKTFTINTVREHPSLAVIHRVMLMDIQRPHTTETGEFKFPQFNGKSFESGFTLLHSVFDDVMGCCELIRSGVYTLESNTSRMANASSTYHDNIKISSSIRGMKSFEQVIPTLVSGDSATVSFSGPLHRFFTGCETVDFFMKDEFPILLMSTDRMLIKTPHAE